MKTKVITTTMITLFLISILTALPARARYGTPVIDGQINVGEWGDPAFTKEGYYNVYVLNNLEYLYVGFETLGGTYLPTGDGAVGMMNVYTMNPETSECWAYCWIHRTPNDVELKYTYPPNPTETPPTDADFAVTATVFELEIPLSELASISLGDTISFHFLSYAEGWNDWVNCWLYNQGYTLELPPECRAIADGTPDRIRWYGVTYSSSDYPDLKAAVHVTRSGQAGFVVHSNSIPMHITATFEVVFVKEEETEWGTKWVFDSVGNVHVRVDSEVGGGYTIEDVGQIRVYVDYSTVSVGPFSDDGTEILKITNVPLINFKQW